MFVLGHLSDIHLAIPPRATDLFGKRGLGLINWHRSRKHVFSRSVLDAVTRDLKSVATDHVAVTGDLVNFSVRPEYVAARAWLESLGPPTAVTVIPGNHDSYVPAARNWPAQYWGDYMRGDDGAAGEFPFVRRRGPVALIALSTSLPTGLFMATGRLGERQLAAFAAALEQTAELFRVVLIHHPPVSPPARYLRRLIDGPDFRRVLAAKGADLVLHGHDHCLSVVWLEGPRGTIPAVGASSASIGAPHGDEDPAGYNLFQIDGTPGGFRCEMIAHQRDAGGGIREIDRRVLSPAPAAVVRIAAPG